VAHPEENKTIVFSILITTKNRIDDLIKTLTLSINLLNRADVECIICDDGSDDKTHIHINDNFPQVKLVRNEKSKGLIYSRNKLLSITVAQYAISLDDDAHFITNNVLEFIDVFFENNPRCAVQAFRIFWGKNIIENTACNLKPKRVKGFVGCGHVWRMSAWNKIPDYPEWFIFYGEEAFASYQLFKNNWEVWFVPQVLVQHRVNIKSRKKDEDYQLRLRRSLRSGWYLYFMFFPKKEIPKKLAYTFWMQLKLKVFKGDYKAFFAIIGATFNLILNLPKLIFKRKPLTDLQLKEFNDLPDAVIYWQPSKEN
jgi:glycosyltransferase involved in cell wall biosynthesis